MDQDFSQNHVFFPPSTSADKQDTVDLLSLRNTQFLQGCLSLGTLLRDCKRPGNAMSPDQVFHT